MTIFATLATGHARDPARPAADAAHAPAGRRCRSCSGCSSGRTRTSFEPETLGPTLDGFVIRVILPLVALVFGTAALGSELEDGTGVHLLTKPISRWTIVVAKTIVAGSLTAALRRALDDHERAPDGRARRARDRGHARVRARRPDRLVRLRLDLPRPLASSRRRGLIIGLAYALIWEGLLAGLLPGSQVFSVREYLAGIAVTLSSDALPEAMVGAGGFLYAAVAFVLVLALGSVRLARYEVRGAE